MIAKLPRTKRTGYEDITGLYFASLRKNAERGKKFFNIKIVDIWTIFWHKIDNANYLVCH